MEINSSQLEEKINSGEKIIVEFWAPWCGPCRIMKPGFEKIAKENTTNVKMYTINIDENRDAAVGLGIRSIPTTKVYNSGETLKTAVGVLSEQDIKKMLKELING